MMRCQQKLGIMTTVHKLSAETAYTRLVGGEKIRPMERLHTLLRMHTIPVTHAASSETATSRHTRRSA